MKIVIVGAGAVGTHLSKLLSREHLDCVLIDDNEERLSALGDYDVMTYCASPTSIKALKEVDNAINKISATILTYSTINRFFVKLLFKFKLKVIFL